MKNKFLVVLVSFCLLFCFGCDFLTELFSFKVVPYENEITLTYDQDIKEYISYTEEDIPSFTLHFEGIVNITENRIGEYECVFAKNDDFFISDIISKLINEYTEKSRISFYEISTDNENETWMNRRDKTEDIDEKVYLKVKDGIIYNEIAYITLENGLQLSINYARFVDDNNITYYRWQTTESIRMVLHYPLMVIDKNDTREFIFIALPNQVRYKFDTTTKKISDLLEKDKFTGSEYYTYEYTNDYNTDYENIVNYYKNNLNGEIVDNILYFTFLGNRFSITFTNDNFTIAYIQD